MRGNGSRLGGPQWGGGTIFSVIGFGLYALTALFTKPPDGRRPYRTGSGGRSVRQFPTDIFPFCRERPVTKEPAAL